MPGKKKVHFHEYRYQILPTTQNVQLDLDGEITSVEDLKAKKNEIFRRVLEHIRAFSYSRGEIRHKCSRLDDLIVLQIGIERDLKRKTREFEVESIENWPTVYVAFDNDPDVQKCLIQRYSGFQCTDTVVKLIESTLNIKLQRYQLAVVFEPIYKESYFWDLVSEYEGKITQIEFELISPNLSNISDSLSLDLGRLHRSTNTQRTNLQLNSDENAYLTPSQEDPQVAELVKYSSQGGGDITIRIKGLRKKKHTAKGINEYSIDEAEIEGKSVEQVADILREVLR